METTIYSILKPEAFTHKAPRRVDDVKLRCRPQSLGVCIPWGLVPPALACLRVECPGPSKYST